MRSSEDRFAASMAGRTYGAASQTVPVAKSTSTSACPVIPEGLLIGELEAGGAVALDLDRLMSGRLLIQGVSGAGKSWLLRRIAEQAHGQVQLIVIDPEGEFESLAALSTSEHAIIHVAGDKLNSAAFDALARRVREHRLSLVLDLSDLDRAEQMTAVANFVQALVDAPREHWFPALIAIDEAHLFAPFGGHHIADTGTRKAAIAAVVDLMSRGRKRGLCGVLATQRLARLAKAVSSEVQNFLVGLNTLDLDIRRAAEQIGWDARKGFERLPLLKPGEFVAVGRAFSTQPAQLKVGPVTTEHRGEAPEVVAPPRAAAAAAATLAELERLIADSQSDQLGMDETLQVGSRAVRAFIRAPGFLAAARVYGALVPLMPQGATLANLRAHLEEIEEVTFDDALALLDGHGVLAFKDGTTDSERVIGIDKNFLNPRGSR